MVRGRLPRESNPVPGQSQPGFVPAFDETGNEDYVRVSNQKPYPVANYTQNSSGVWLPTSQNNPMPTQLTGSIEEIEIFSGLTITDNNWINNTKNDLPGHIVAIKIINNHNGSIQFDVRGRGSRHIQTLGESSLKSMFTEVLHSSGTSLLVIDKTTRGWNILESFYDSSVSFLIRGVANDLPTSGSLSLSILCKTGGVIVA